MNDLIRRAEHALEDGDSADEVARAYGRRASKAGCLPQLRDLCRQYDGAAGDSVLLDVALNGSASMAPVRRPGIAPNEPSVPVTNLYAHLDGTGLEYDLHPYTAKGRFILLSAPPKRGKSTFASLYAHAKAAGSTFLGQQLAQEPVLYVAPDENQMDVARRFRSFGTPGEVHIWTDPRRSIEAIAARARQLDCGLVVLDTLLRVAQISDENDNAEWDRWFGNARDHVHSSGAVWFGVHHDRKSGGSDGEGIRGASAIFGSVDVAISLQSSDEGSRRRILRVEGTRLDHADPLVIELNAAEARYDAVGEAKVVSILKDSALERLRGVLTSEPQTVSAIDKALRSLHSEDEDIAEGTVRKRLDRLVNAGLAERTGEGGRRDPYRYSLTRSRDADSASERETEGPRETEVTRSPGREDTPLDGERDGARLLTHDPGGREQVSVEGEQSHPDLELF